MGSDRSADSDYFVGMAIPSSEWAFWADESTADWQGGFPGKAVPDRTSPLRVIPSSPFVESSNPLEVRTVKGGTPGAFLWRENASGDWYGWDPPNVFAGLETITDSGTVDDVAFAYLPPSGTLLEPVTGRILRLESNRSGTTRSILVSRRNGLVSGTVGIWTRGTAIASQEVDSGLTGRRMHASIHIEGSLAVIYAVRWGEVDTAQEDVAYIDRYESSDGASWELSAKDVIGSIPIPTSPGLEVQSIQVESSGGQWMLLLTMLQTGSTPYVVQMASKDGITFEFVGSTSNAWAHSIVVADGAFVVLMTTDLSSDYEPITLRVGSAFTNLASTLAAGQYTQLSAQGTSSAYGAGDLFLDDSGRIWAYLGVGSSTTREIATVYSEDGGVSWVPGSTTGSGLNEPQVCYESSDRTVIAATFARGAAFAAFDTGRGRVHVMGGWTNVPSWHAHTDFTGNALAAVSGRIPDAVARYRVCWDNPTDSLTTAGLTESLTGSPTVSGGSLSGASTSDEVEYTFTSSLAKYSHQVVLFRCDPDGAVGDSQITAELKVGPTAAAFSYAADVYLDFSTGAIRLYDTAAFTLLASVDMPATEFEVRLAVSAGKASAWYREVSDGALVRDWTPVGTDQTLTDNGGTSNTIKVRAYRDPAKGSGAWNVEWTGLWLNDGNFERLGGFTLPLGGEGQGQGVRSDFSNISHKSYSTRPVFAHNGISVRARGSARRNDVFTITPSATHHPDRVLPEVRPSPRHAFKGATSTPPVLAFRRAAGQVQADHHAMVVFWNAANCMRSCTVAIRSGGVWSDVGTIQSRIAVDGIVLSTDGYSGVPSGGGASSAEAPYFRRNQLAGCWIYDDGTFYEISGNTAGTWDGGAANEKRCTVYFTTPHPNGGTARSGVEVVLDKGFALIHGTQNRNFDGVRFTCNANSVAGSVPEIGTLLLEDVVLFGRAPDSTRAVVTELGEVAEETEDGHTFLDDTRPPRRRVELSWTRAAPVWNQQSGDFDYVQLNSQYGPAGDAGDHLLLLEALIQSRQRKPILLLPRLPKSTTLSDFVQVVEDDAGGAMLCRFVPDTFRREGTGGRHYIETGWEMQHGSVVTLREIV